MRPNDACYKRARREIAICVRGAIRQMPGFEIFNQEWQRLHCCDSAWLINVAFGTSVNPAQTVHQDVLAQQAHGLFMSPSALVAGTLTRKRLLPPLASIKGKRGGREQHVHVGLCCFWPGWLATFASKWNKGQKVWETTPLPVLNKLKVIPSNIHSLTPIALSVV